MRKPTMKYAYTRAVIRDIKQRAMKIIGATSVNHIRPRAYCVAKPAPQCAVFAVPPCDAEPQIHFSLNAASETVANESSGIAMVGKWYSLAYVTTPGSGQNYVIGAAV